MFLGRWLSLLRMSLLLGNDFFIVSLVCVYVCEFVGGFVEVC